MKNSELESLNTEEAFDYDAGIDSVLGEFPDDLQNRYEEELEK